VRICQTEACTSNCTNEKVYTRYTQCENMSLHYKTPVLLIEFDQNKSFSLQVVLANTILIGLSIY
jgi:hypothetical protein